MVPVVVVAVVMDIMLALEDFFPGGGP